FRYRPSGPGLGYRHRPTARRPYKGHAHHHGHAWIDGAVGRVPFTTSLTILWWSYGLCGRGFVHAGKVSVCKLPGCPQTGHWTREACGTHVNGSIDDSRVVQVRSAGISEMAT